MKTIFTIIITLAPLGACFSPNAKAAQRTTTTVTTPTSLPQTKKVEEITHELKELGQEIKPHVIGHETHGFGAKESVAHRLRRELREKDKLYHELLDEMELIEHRQLGMTDLQTVLERTLTEIQQQNAMLRHKKDVSKQQEDTLRALMETVKELHDNLVQANAFAVAWETAEVEVLREKRELEKLQKQHDSVRSLLWQAMKVTGRRAKNLFKRILFLK